MDLNVSHKVLWSNMFYIYKKLAASHHKFFRISITIILVDIMIPILNALFPKFILMASHSKGNQYQSLFLTISIFFLLMSPTQAISNYFVRRNNFYLSNMGIKLKEGIQSKAMKMEYAMTEDPTILNKIQVAYQCTDKTKNIVQVICGFCSSFILLIICSVFILHFRFWFFLFLIVNVWINLFILNKTKKYESLQRENRSGIERRKNYLFQTMFDYHYGKEIRIFHMGSVIEKKFKKQKQEMKEINTAVQEQQFFFLCTESTLTFIRDLLLYVLLLYAYLNGDITIDNFVFYLSLVTSFSTAAKAMSENISQIIYLSPYVSDYRDFVEGEEQKKDRDQICEIVNFSIEFQHVFFHYPESKQMVLEDISFKIPEGQHVALVGLNGSGKTTIVKLLCGFYQPSKGKILVGGKNICQFDPEEYRKKISAVFQDSKLYALTLEENIYAGLKGDKAKMWEIFEQLQMSSIVKNLEKQEQSNVLKNLYEDGVEFSGGEMQKLCIARAMYREGGIILLDEPTAAFDALAEKKLYESFDLIAKGKTAIFISHRLNSNRFCDLVLYLEHGKIVAQGSHNELYSICDSYHELYDMQAQYYQEQEGTL